MWHGQGFNATLELPYEAMPSGDSNAGPTRYRAMACARQLFVFAEAGHQEHAAKLFNALRRYFTDTQLGGFVYSVDADGKPYETEKDLYTHAFVIFACAAYFKRFGDPDATRMMNDCADVIEGRFTIDPRHDLPNASLSQDFTQVRIAARQNPLMHLTEAYLAARDATGDPRYDKALDALLPRIAAAFIDVGSGCIMERPSADPASWIEPGHQFEWFYLWRQSAHPSFNHAGLDQSLMKAFQFAQQHGIDADTKGVVASLNRDGTVLDGSQRIWAQTEYLRALATHPESGQRALLPDQIAYFSRRYLHASGWFECFAATGEVSRTDMPSTTAYHLASGYAALG
jgi:mannose-6-phosphate isomerase